MIKKICYLLMLNMLFLNVILGDTEISKELQEKVKEKVLYEYDNTNILINSHEFVDKIINDVKINYFIEKRMIPNINEVEYKNYQKENNELSNMTEIEKKKISNLFYVLYLI